MPRISINHAPYRIWYQDFSAIVKDFLEDDGINDDNRLWAYISDIVLYNVCYRDILRKEGIQGILESLSAEEPAFRNQHQAIQYLRSSIERNGPLADYDIQCLSVQDTFLVHGREFKGLRDVKESVEWYLRRRREPYRAGGLHRWKGDVHILCNYEPYPIFDSSDWGDDRTYCNYFFQNRQFQPSDFEEIEGIRENGNFCKAHERLTRVDERPLLYYPGDGKTMLLVTPK